jgi:hypothetical protein
MESGPMKINGWTVPSWMHSLNKEARSAVLAGFDDRCPEFMIRDFEKGEVPMDEPPGLTERAYMLWKFCGGEVIPPKPVTADDL